MEPEASILALNDEFYRAFEALDVERMARVWSRSDTDVCIHPGWEILRGWDEIREAWRVIFANTGYMRFEASDVTLDVSGPTARLNCVENIFSVAQGMTVHSRVACSNVFVLIEGEWQMVLHHGSPIAASQSVHSTDGDPDN